MTIRFLVTWLGLTLVATPAWAPTLNGTPVAAADAQKEEAELFVRQYRPLLRQDSLRLTDSLAYLIVQAADRHGVERRIAFGLVWTESRFKVDARGKVGDAGLVQILPSTARLTCGIRTQRELYEPATNLDCGFRFYAQMLARYGAVDWLALVAYNRGPRIADSLKAQGLGYPEQILAAR
ncbi:MAG TPA: transglycosylase SLT domain-containing protein [Gemmatimonadales bacterium]|jgi:soluble lytic murein transglycosylase-like protein